MADASPFDAYACLIVDEFQNDLASMYGNGELSGTTIANSISFGLSLTKRIQGEVPCQPHLKRIVKGQS